MSTPQTRREFCKGVACTAAGTMLGVSGCSQLQGINGRNEQRPNLLFVFSDQQSRDTLGCYGNPQVQTPNIDRLAYEGLRLNHCVSISPVCTPFRAMLMSGQHPLYCGGYHNDVPLLANNGSYFGHVLQEAGYRTGYVGKWHLLGGDRNRPVPEGPMRYGFDDCFLSNNCHVDFRPGKCFYWNEKGERIYFDEWEVYGQTRQAVEFLDDCSNDEPFALFVSWHPPHDWGIHPESLVFRYDTLEELMDLYDPATLKLRPSAIDHPAVRKAYQGYYAMCTGVDVAFGRLMDKLRQKGLDENTLVVFTSDHGANLQSYGYTIAKDHPEDTASGIPFLIRWPQGLPSNRTSDLLLGPMDMMPTILGLMGLNVPDTVQGQDLSRALLKGDDDAVESLPMFFIHPAWRGVYTRDVTYARGRIMHFTHGLNGRPTPAVFPLQALYDRRKDPHQLNNLFDQPQARSLQNRMEKMAQDWMDRFNDPGVGSDVLDPLYRYPDGRWPEDTHEAGFPGRPIDLCQNGTILPA